VVGGYGAAHWQVNRTVKSQLDQAAQMAVECLIEHKP
jgi:hypothetical protein